MRNYRTEWRLSYAYTDGTPPIFRRYRLRKEAMVAAIDIRLNVRQVQWIEVERVRTEMTMYFYPLKDYTRIFRFSRS